MYKPPENTNRVKAIKSKFENNENINIQVSVTKNKKIPPTLSRQLSDPIKVNIKRTPAFRNDKQFQRNGTQISCRTKSENKSLTEKTCDNISASPQKQSVTISKSQLACSASNFNNLRKRFDSQENLAQQKPHPKALRERCNTSAEIIINKEKMRQKLSDKKIEIEENLNKTLHKTSVKILDIPKGNQELKYENLCMLYTEPIPKAQRAKENNLSDIHNSNTLTIEEKNSVSRVISDSANLNKDPVSTNVGHAKCHDDIINYKLNALTDTLKLALKKPLPNGPAPKKPPRTFTHSPQSKLQLKSEFEKKLKLNLQKDIDLRKKSRADPKYMLDKLENALKNNKIRLKKDTKLDYTSEEDNCESPRKSKAKSTVPNSKFNFNCLQSLSCSNATYERMSTQKSPAVSNARKEEPVYAEPFVFPQGDGQVNLKTRLDSKKCNRNSLYYMSTPVISPNEGGISDDMEDHGLSHSDAGEETSSISTPTTSDIDSITSTPSEESKQFSSSKIKDLIKSFEQPNMDNRVDKLGKQLRQTLERSFSASTGDTNDTEMCAERSSTEGETSDAMAGEFETYVRTIRLFSRQRRKCDGKNLFYCCILVGLNGRAPYIKFQFPQKVELPHKIEELCFPDSVDSIIDCSVKAQNYSIVLTNHTGERIYGYCRRVLPESSTTCLPLAYCILSKQRAPRFYRRILEELESRHGIPDKIRDILWNEFYYHRFPMPGETIRINLVEVNKFLSDVTLLDDKRCDTNGLISNQNGNSKNGDVDFTSFVPCNGRGVYGTLNKKSDNKRNGILFTNDIIPTELMEENEITSLSTPTELIITLHQDSRYKENDLEEICNTLKSDILQKIFASLLLERKVIFISTLLGKLSTCIEAIQNMLYPFSWPHTLIPVIPKDLWEIVEAPTPLICGALSLSVVYDYVIEYGIVVNLDKGEILKEVGDEGKILPGALVKEFKDGMSLAHSSSGENENAFNVLLSDAFLRIFITSCGHYKDFIKDGNFQKEEFLQYPKSKSIRRFLRWFTETTMFCTFIDTVLADASSFTIFDKRIQIYSSPDANLILGKMKDWKKEKTNTFF